jgi:hypothetical protein
MDDNDIDTMIIVGILVLIIIVVSFIFHVDNTSKNYDALIQHTWTTGKYNDNYHVTFKIIDGNQMTCDVSDEDTFGKLIETHEENITVIHYNTLNSCSVSNVTLDKGVMNE